MNSGYDENMIEMRHEKNVMISKKRFVFFYMIICGAVLLMYFLPLKKHNGQENRQMAEFTHVFHPPEKTSVVYKDSYVERFEAAMKDQFAYRSHVLKVYMFIENFSAHLSNMIMLRNVPYHWYEYIGKYIRIDGTDWLTTPSMLSEVTDEQIAIHIKQIERIHREYPKIKIYNYFVNQAYDTDWFDEYLGRTTPDKASEIEARIPSYIRSSHFYVGSFADYQMHHYMTDHHWNHVGANRGYQDIYHMMAKELDGLGEMAVPYEEVNYTEKWNMPFKGSFARGLGSIYSATDIFSVFRYTLPKRKISVVNPSSYEEIPLKEMCLWDEYDSGKSEMGANHYETFYGTAKDENGNRYADERHIFKIVNTDIDRVHNLLIIGDSYNRAFRDAISTNFHTTVYLDHRVMQLPDIHRIIEDNDIDVILLSGHGSTWTYSYSLFNFGDE